MRRWLTPLWASVFPPAKGGWSRRTQTRLLGLATFDFARCILELCEEGISPSAIPDWCGFRSALALTPALELDTSVYQPLPGNHTLQLDMWRFLGADSELISKRIQSHVTDRGEQDSHNDTNTRILFAASGRGHFSQLLKYVFFFLSHKFLLYRNHYWAGEKGPHPSNTYTHTSMESLIKENYTISL